MCDALARDDLDAVRNGAHSIKGSSRNVCAMTLGDLCEELETLTRRGVRPEELSAQVEKLRRECEALCESATSFLPQV
jgi:HPt (histidine-containing phosphotransfer) domain-containing protein